MRIVANRRAETAPAAIPVSMARQVPLILLISALLLIPCYWQSHIEAGDLGSHVYNAWLAQLIEQRMAPGLYTVSQWNNVLLDALLLSFSKMFGFGMAEKLATSLSVLIFFWGVFLFLRAMSGQAPWFLTPLIAMLAYGAIFHMGFLNYYTSVGLACIALSLLWPARPNGALAAALLAPVILLAHALGFVLFVGIGVYRLLWLRLPTSWKWILPLGVLLVCLAVRWYVAVHPDLEVQWRTAAFWRLTGFDQFHVFGPRYRFFTRAIFLLAVLSTVLALLRARDRRHFWQERRLPVELYLLSFCAVALLPEKIHPDPNGGWVGEIAARLTLPIAIFAIAWLATLPRRRWHLFAYAAVATVFFLFLYQDTSYLNRMEQNAQQVASELPFGTRVLATVHTPEEYHVDFIHIPERACIGHCFMFSNYEASTKQFRIRVRSGSPVVTASVYDALRMQAGTYEVRENDLPLKQIYQCDARDLTLICLRDLSADEANGRLGYVPPPDRAAMQSTPVSLKRQVH